MRYCILLLFTELHLFVSTAALAQTRTEATNGDKAKSIIELFQESISKGQAEFVAGFNAISNVHLGSAACYDSITDSDFRTSVENWPAPNITQWMLDSYRQIKKQRKIANLRPIVVSVELLLPNGTVERPMLIGSSSELVTPKRWKKIDDWVREALPSGGRTGVELLHRRNDHKYGPVLIRERYLKIQKAPEKIPLANISVIWEAFDDSGISTDSFVEQQSFEWNEKEWIKRKPK